MPGADLILDKGFVATAAVGQFRAVTLATSANERVTQSVADGLVLGICQEDVSATDATNEKVAQIRLIGISTCIAGAAITRGERVKSDATGRVTSTGLAAGNPLVGIAMESAAAAGDHVHVFLTPGVKF